MSEPLSSHEIEDVLSSIRRLVSDDLRPQMRLAEEGPEETSGTAEGDAAQENEAPGKLMLTPALRVVGEESENLSGASRSPAPPGEARVWFGEAAPLNVGAGSWSDPDAPAAADEAAAAPGPGMAAEEKVEEEDSSPIAVFTAAKRPAPLLLTPKEQTEAAQEAVPFIRHPREPAPARESVVIDEMALRALLRQIVREELAAMQLTGAGAPDMRRMVRLELQRSISTES